MAVAAHAQSTGDYLKRIDANPLAVQAGNLRAANVVLMGALSAFVPFDEEHWQAALRERIPAKLLDVNLRAFAAGRAAVR